MLLPCLIFGIISKLLECKRQYVPPIPDGRDTPLLAKAISPHHCDWGRVGVRGGGGGGGGLLPARVLDLHQLHWADAEADPRHSRHLAKTETRTLLIHKQSKQKQKI